MVATDRVAHRASALDVDTCIIVPADEIALTRCASPDKVVAGSITDLDTAAAVGNSRYTIDTYTDVIATDGIAQRAAFPDGDSVVAIAGDEIALPRCIAADVVVGRGPVDVDAVTIGSIWESGRATGVGADQVAADRVAGRAKDLDARHTVPADQVARATAAAIRRGIDAANDIVAATDDDASIGIADGFVARDGEKGWEIQWRCLDNSFAGGKEKGERGKEKTTP